jgi:plastocyanin
MYMRTPMLLVLGATGAALAVAGCGGGGSNTSTSASSSPAPAASTTPATSTPASSGGTSSGSGSSLKISADPSGKLAFNTKTLSAKAGKVTITMDNPSAVPHGVAIEGGGVDKDGQVVNKGGKSTVSVTLKPGKYTFYCPVPGHKEAGMEGTLTVQ